MTHCRTTRALAALPFLALAGTGAVLTSPGRATFHPGPSAAVAAAADVMTQSLAAYAALKSYADSGTVTDEYGAPDHPTDDVNHFHTFMARPGRYFLEFLKHDNLDRGVIWARPDSGLHVWYRSSASVTDYSPSNETTAFNLNEYSTRSTITVIAPLFFNKARLTGTVTEITGPEEVGMETIDGHPCHKIVGIAKQVYQTGYESDKRRTTVWVDAQTLLIRKIFEEWKAPPGSVNRRFITISPHANPALSDATFTFTPPDTQQ
jgi:outer membrane lipoprotein-sorting protein